MQGNNRHDGEEIVIYLQTRCRYVEVAKVMYRDPKLMICDRVWEPIVLKTMAEGLLWPTSRRESAAAMALGRYSIAGIEQ